MAEKVDTVIIGAGQAGLGMAYLLQQAGRDYIVLERGRIGETWRSQRWDSFALNTPNLTNYLPGLPYDGAEPDGFWPRDELVEYLTHYAARYSLNIRTGMNVTAVDPSPTGESFVVQAEDSSGGKQVFDARSVVFAAGILNVPVVPRLAEKLPSRILQLHTADYRNPDELPEGAVVVVGSGQSGCQIVEDILPSGRKVYLFTSKVGRVPRRYRGRDILEWWIDTGFWSTTLDELEDPEMTKMRQPQISGIGRYGHTVSLQHLARAGTVILGRLKSVEEESLVFENNAADHVAFADALSKRVKIQLDEYIEKNGISAPHIPDPADEPDPELTCVSELASLDLNEAGVGTVIWATGLRGDFSWIHFPILDADGSPRHHRGVSNVPGIFFLGFPWLHSRKSGVIYGIEEDARFLLGEIERWIGHS